MSNTTTTTLAAALWDFDGTLADTEPLWVAAEFDLVNGLGAEWSSEHAKDMIGRSLLDSSAMILDIIGRHDLSPAWCVDQLLTRVVHTLRTEPIPWRPGAVELLQGFRDAGIPCALVSASYRVLLDAALDQLPPGAFAVSVAGDEVTQGKPHPEPYERACQLLGVEAENCVVFEDSATGARSGNAAGALVLAVENLIPVPAAPRRVHLNSLSDLDVSAVHRLLVAAEKRSWFDDPA
jgi:HAD superfamily hydrolase (TIGR01509 family)